MSHKQPGLDNRHRNQDGEIHRKQGNTLVANLRAELWTGIPISLSRRCRP